LLAIAFFTVSQCIWRRWGKKATARRRRSGEVDFSADRAEFATYDALPRRIESLKIPNSPQRRAKWNFSRQFGGKTNRIMSGSRA
jgi:hypothetical protein